MEQAIYNEVYGIGRILSDSWQCFKQKFWTIILITVAVYLPIEIIVRLWMPVNSVFMNGGIVTSATFYVLGMEFLEFLIGILVVMGVAYLVKFTIDGHQLTAAQALKRSLSKWPVAFGTNLLTNIFIIGLTLLLIVPGIIYGIYWIFVIYAVVLHDKSWTEAMDYSKEIVKGRWGRVFLYVLSFFLLELLVTFGASTIYGVLGGLIAPLVPAYVAVAVDIVISLLGDIVTVFFVVVFAVFFINLDANRKNNMNNIAIAS